MSCDPNFANVVLLLSCDGTSGSTSFPDTSNLANPMTATGGANVDTAIKEFGTGSAVFAGLGNGITTPITGGGPLDPGTGSWTIECWVNFNDITPQSRFLALGEAPFVNDGIMLQQQGGALSLYVGSTSLGASSAAVTINTWQHIAIEYDAALGEYQVFVDGIGGAIVPHAAMNTPVGSIHIGGFINLFSSSGMLGNIDEARITYGIVRYPIGVNFTPPSTAFGLACPTVLVPNVVGETIAQATMDIVAATLTVGTVSFASSSTIPAGSIISQSPVGGAFTFAGAPVDLIESSGASEIVPDLTNTSIAVVAPALLAAAHLILGTVAYEANVLIIPGNVIRQSPAAGTVVSAGSAVNVVVSLGRGPVPVPDLIGLTQDAAVTLLLSVGLVPGAIGVTYSTTVPAGIVISQNIGPGIPYPIVIASGSLVGFVVSLGPPPTDTMFDYAPTVISQYANSPTLLQWLANMNQYLDQSANFANFLSYIWNVDSAVGFGLDIWGKIVDVSRLLRIPNSTPYVGFHIASESQAAQDWTPAGSNQPPYNNPPVGGAMYTGYNATQAYLLDDNSYRQLVLAKAFANIAASTAPAINQILQNIYGVGQAYVLNSGVMAITYNFNFKPTPVQLAILEQSGVIPTPPGVAFSVITP